MTQLNGSMETVSEQNLDVVDGGVSGWGWAGAYVGVIGLACPPCAVAAGVIATGLFVIDVLSE